MLPSLAASITCKKIKIPIMIKYLKPVQSDPPAKRNAIWPLCPPLPSKFSLPLTSGSKRKLDPGRTAIHEHFAKIPHPFSRYCGCKKKNSMPHPSKLVRFFAFLPQRTMPATLWQSSRKKSHDRNSRS